MILQKVNQFLLSLPYAKPSGNDYVLCRCPYCGDSFKHEDNTHFSIKVNVENHEPLFCKCFRAECQEHGYLTTELLQRLGCTDMETIMELSEYNNSINKQLDRSFNNRKQKEYQLVNRSTKLNNTKLDYINRRLGTDFTIPDLRNFRIQLSLYDLVSINDIHKLAYGKRMCDLLECYTIGFVSMYRDYLICRDISKDLVTGKRYNIYRISGKPESEDIKLYSIPTEIQLLDPKSAIINVAEGPFSILGPYLHTDLGRNKPNVLWLANCGANYLNSIMHTCKQYGLLKVQINIWSDSEIKVNKYEKLYKDIKDRLDIRKFTVFYNAIAEDFGQPKDKIKVEQVTIYDKDSD